MWDLEPLLGKLKELWLYFSPQLMTVTVIMFNLHTDFDK